MISAYGLPALADVNTQPAQQSESAASIIDTSILGQELAGGGQTRALFPGGPLSDQGGLDLSLLGSEVIDLGGIPIPLDQLIDFGQMGVLNSQSQTTDGKNARAISGIAGADGAVTLDGADGDFGAARINLLSLFEKAGIAGATDLLIDEATLLAGAGGAQVIAQDGEFLDPDGFGGKGQYRVAEASLLLHSPTIEQIASDLYDQLGQVDQTMEDTVNGMLDLTSLASALPGVTLDASVESNMRDEIFAAILAQPITTNNQVLTVDFSTGTITIQLDQIYSGERPEGPDAPDGINNQAPNTEVIDDTIYPIIAETVHDLMEEVTNIAVGAIEGALGSVTVNLTAGMTTPLGGAVATTSINLMGDLGQVQCTPSGLGGAAVCTTLTTMLNAAGPVLTTFVQPVRDFILSDGGQQIFDTLVGGIKTGAITLPIRMLLSPFFEVLTQAISLQLNRQVVTTCVAPDGSTKTASLEVSALSLGLAQAVDGARLNLGSAGARIGACAAAIDPAITVDPTQVPAGGTTNVDGTGFTPNGDVQIQLLDPNGNPVCTPVTVPADATGVFTTDLPICADIPPGNYTVRATDVTTNTPVTAPLEVLQPNVQELNIGLDPPTVPAGDPTNATGTGYTPNGPVTVQLLDPAGAPVGAPIPTTADANGGFTVPVPTPADAAPGTYTVRGTDDTTDNSAEAPLTVVEPGSPVLTVDPASVPAGDPTNATGTDYTPNGPVTVQLLDPAGAPVGAPIPTTADANGGFTVPVPVPADAAPGDYTVRGTDNTTNEAPTAPLTVTAPAAAPSIVADPASVPAGDPTNATGSNYTPNGPVTVQLLDPAGAPVGAPIPTTADANGGFTVPVPTPADAAPGNYTIRGTDNTTNEAPTAPLTVTAPAAAPSIVADPATVAAGDPTNATGSDYTPNGPVTVQLLDPAGAPVGAPIPTTADANGGFTVPVPTPADAAPGDYSVRGTDNTTNEAPTAPLTVVAPGSPILTVDPASVPAGDPTNATGSDYTPNGPVTVQLLDPAGAPVGAPIPTTADANGGFTVPVPTPADAAPGDYSVRGTDNTTNEAPTAPLAITDGGAGGPGSIGDRVWSDLDSDGVQDAGEPGLAGVTVNLLDAQGAPVNGADGQPVTAASDENGAYLFEGLQLGGYVVEFAGLPQGASFSPVGAGDNGAVDSDAASDTGRTGVVTLTAEAPANLDVDAGVVGAPVPTEPTVTVDPSTVPAGDDTQVTGVGFAPNSPVQVQLLDPAGNPVGEPVALTSDENGGFTTPLTVPEGSAPGEYSVKAVDGEGNEDTAPLTVTAPATAPSIVADPASVPAGDPTNATGSDYTPNGPVTVQLLDPAGAPVGAPIPTTADANGGFTVPVPTPADAAPGDYSVRGTDNTTNEAPTAPLAITDGGAGGPGSIGDRVWSDLDSDGVQDAGEPGLAGVTVNLLDAQGAPVNGADGQPVTAASDENGAYLFEGLQLGGYVVEFAGLPQGASFSPVGAGDNGAADSDAASDTGRTGVVTLTAEAPANLDVDAGVVGAPVPTEPTVTVDPSTVPAGDDTQVTGQGFAPNSPVQVQLLDPAGNPVGEPVAVTTDDEGNFTTPLTVPEGSAPGEYSVKAVDGEGNEDTAPLTVTEGTAGGPGSIGDRVWSDLDSDGVQDAGEPGLAGVTVNLLDAQGAPVNGADGQPVTAASDENGAYLFEGLQLGGYVVEFAGLPQGASFSPVGAGDNGAVDSDAASDTGRTGVVTLTAEAPANLDVDAGVVGAPVPTEPTVTVDPSTVPAGDDTQVTGQGFAPDSTVTVQLLDPAGAPVGTPVENVPTDAEGGFTTPLTVPEGSAPGEYSVKGTDAEGGTDTAPLTVTEAAAPSVTVDPTSVPAGDDTTVAGEGFAPNSPVTVQLVDSEGNPVGEPVEVTTDENGNFTTPLTVPEGTEPGEYGVVATDDQGGEAEAPLTVTDGSAGGPGSTTGRVWSDLDSDGVQDAGEPGLAGVTVNLLDAQGAPVNGADGQPVTAASDENGAYLFEGLQLGGYVVEFAGLPQGASFSPMGAGDDTTVDSDAGENGRSAVVTLTADAPAAVVDAGVIGAPAPTEPTVTVDPSTVPAGDDTQVTGQGFAPNSPVQVQLLDPAGNPVGEPVAVTTDDEGNFTTPLTVPEGSAPGEYSVKAVDGEGGEDSTPLTVTDGSTDPSVTVDPTAVAPGDATTVTGEGFAPNSPVTVQLVDSEGNPVGEPVEVTTDENGNFTTPLTVPEGTEPGEYGVVATDDQGNEAETPLTVIEAGSVDPTIAVDPAVVPQAGTTQVTGGGYSPNADVKVELLTAAGNAIATVDTTSNANGAISVALTVPADAAIASTYKVRGTDGPTKLTAETGLEVVAAPTTSCEANPGITVVPSKVQAGGTAKVVGKGYTKGETLSITLVNSSGNAVDIKVAGGTETAGNAFTVVVGNDCAFTVDITVPKGTAAGDYNVIVKDKDGKEKGKAPLEVTISVVPGSSGNNGGNGSLPDTGAQVLGLSGLALLLLIGGALTVVAVRTRSRRS